MHSNLFGIQIHVRYVRIPVVLSKSFVDHLVVVVDEIDVRQDFIDLLGWADNILVDRDGSTKVNSRLHQVVGAKVVPSVWALVISAK
jgi:hypothetical protein